MIICQGCGQAFDPPEGYTRAKIQCPGCGVICLVPAGAAREPATPKRAAPQRATEPAAPAQLEKQAAAWLDDDSEPIPLEVDDSAPAVAHTDAPGVERESGTEGIPLLPPRRRPEEALIKCRRCGRPVRRQRECPVCDAAAEPDVVPEEPAEPVSARVGLAPHSLELDERPAAPPESEEDDSPYVLADRLLPRCPKCYKDMPEGSVLCISCGFDLRTRRRMKRNYEPVHRSWDATAPLSRRLAWFAAGQGFHVFLALLSALGGFSIWPFVVAWPLMTGVLAFLLGTYDRIELTRDTRGRVKITRTWHFCFVPLAPVVTEVRGFEGVTTGQWHDAGFLEWFVFFSLLLLAVIPSLIWYYHAIHTPQFYVALARDHGRSEFYVYRGRNQEQMLEIANVLCQAAELRNIT